MHPETPQAPARNSRQPKRYTLDEAMTETKSTSPREALEKLKATDKRYSYLPHQGAKERAKALKRMQRETA